MVQPESPGKARCALQCCLALEAFRLTQAANARHNLSFACKCLHMGGFTCARFLQLQRFMPADKTVTTSCWVQDLLPVH